MKVKTVELTDAALDWTVAKIKCELPASFDNWTQFWPHYSTDVKLAWPIILKEQINLINPTFDYFHTDFPALAMLRKGEREFFGYGDTPLIAAMRCFVLSRLGEEVEVPEELL